jgi:NADPH:quinone reductase-like Zn-dependent oxidoreductase
VGDHVSGLCADVCWRTYVTCDAPLAVTLPAGLADQQAAGLTTAHATTYCGVHELVRIKSGDKVLIQSGTGRAGQAAMAIAPDFGRTPRRIPVPGFWDASLWSLTYEVMCTSPLLASA